MRTISGVNRSRLIAAARGAAQCDLTIANAQLLNVITGETYTTDVDVLDGVIVRVREEGRPAASRAKAVYDAAGRYLIPGFIDTHMHVESTMMVPSNFGRAAAVWGTTTVVTDPHEIANVMGIEGVTFMLEDAKKSALRQYVLAPSCVPSLPGFEGGGAAFGAQEVARVLDMPGVLGIAELMDYPGVISDSARMHEIIDEGLKRDMFLEAHAPAVTGEELAAYLLGGPRSDHESIDAREIREKIRNGMHIDLRASSMIDDLPHLLKGFEGLKWLDFVSICTDDVHAGDLIGRGHINAIVSRLIDAGMDAVEVMKLATLNAAREYGFEDLGAIAPGYSADMQIVRSLDGSRPDAVFIRGQLVAEDGVYLGGDGGRERLQPVNTMNVASIGSAGDFALNVPEGYAGATIKVNVLRPLDGSPVLRRIAPMELPVVNGRVDISGHGDLCFVAIANRYGAKDRTVAVLGGFGLNDGAFASTVSHDCHNFMALYKKPEDAFAALEALKKCGGGFCAVRAGRVLSTIELPVAGLMSLMPVKELAEEAHAFEETLHEICEARITLLSAAVVALPVLPGVTVTDRGMVDGINMRFMPVFGA